MKVLTFTGNAQKLERFRAANSRPYGGNVMRFKTANNNLSVREKNVQG